MSDDNESKGDTSKRTTLAESDIVVQRIRERRSFLAMLGVAAAGATALVLTAKAKSSNFPKGNSDSDETENADLKTADTDSHNSKAVDSNQNRLRDVKRSTDSD